MNESTEKLPLGAPFAIGEALVAALREEFRLSSDGLCVVLDNPIRLADLADVGPRVVFFEETVDRWKTQAGNTQIRTYAFNVGAINRTETARASAHRDYRKAKQAIRQSLKVLRSVVDVSSTLREGDVTFRVENIDVGGGLVMGSFTVEYRDPV